MQALCTSNNKNMHTHIYLYTATDILISLLFGTRMAISTVIKYAYENASLCALGC